MCLQNVCMQNVKSRPRLQSRAQPHPILYFLTISAHLSAKKFSRRNFFLTTSPPPPSPKKFWTGYHFRGQKFSEDTTGFWKNKKHKFCTFFAKFALCASTWVQLSAPAPILRVILRTWKSFYAPAPISPKLSAPEISAKSAILCSLDQDVSH